MFENYKNMTLEELREYIKCNFKERLNTSELHKFSYRIKRVLELNWSSLSIKELLDSIYWEKLSYVEKNIWSLEKDWKELFFKKLKEFFNWERPRRKDKRKIYIDNYLTKHWLVITDVYNEVFWKNYKSELSKELVELDYEWLKRKVFELFEWKRPDKNSDQKLRNQVEDFLTNKWIKMWKFYDEIFWRVISDTEKFLWKELLEAKDKDAIMNEIFKLFNWERPSAKIHWRKYILLVPLLRRKWFHQFANFMDEIFWEDSRSEFSNNQFKEKLDWIWNLNELEWEEFLQWLFNFCNWIRPEYKDENWSSSRYCKIVSICNRKWYQNVENLFDEVFWKMKEETVYKEFRFLEWEEFKKWVFNYFKWVRPTEIWEDSSWRSYIVLFRVIKQKWYERPKLFLDEVFKNK